MNTANCWKAQIIQKKNWIHWKCHPGLNHHQNHGFSPISMMNQTLNLGISNGGYIIPPIVLMVVGILGFLNHLKMVRNHRTQEFNRRFFRYFFLGQFLHHYVSVYLSEVKRKGYDITVVLIFQLCTPKIGEMIHFCLAHPLQMMWGWGVQATNKLVEIPGVHTLDPKKIPPPNPDRSERQADAARLLTTAMIHQVTLGWVVVKG